MSAVRTVSGDIPADRLGVCDAHDHLFLRSPRLPGQELDDERLAEAELVAFREAGGSAVVQWTPFGMGRGARALADLARVTGVHVVAATGLHQAAHYDPAVLDGMRDRLADLFVEELTVAIRGTEKPGPPVRAGFVKVAAGFHGLDGHARTTLTAAAHAYHATGCAIAVHLEHGTAAGEVVGFLCDRLGVPPGRVVLGHLNRSPDGRRIRAMADAGVVMAFDGPSRAHHGTDWRTVDLITALVGAGHGDRIVVGADTTVASARATSGEGPGMPYLLTGLQPALEREFGAAATRTIFVDNPAKAFGNAWPAS